MSRYYKVKISLINKHNGIIPGFFNLAVLALFAVGSFAVHIPKHHDLESKEDNENGFLKKGKKWVVLVAGSKGWNNYRHQVTKYYSK